MKEGDKSFVRVCVYVCVCVCVVSGWVIDVIHVLGGVSK